MAFPAFLFPLASFLVCLGLTLWIFWKPKTFLILIFWAVACLLLFGWLGLAGCIASLLLIASRQPPVQTRVKSSSRSKHE